MWHIAITDEMVSFKIPNPGSPVCRSGDSQNFYDDGGKSEQHFSWGKWIRAVNLANKRLSDFDRTTSISLIRREQPMARGEADVCEHRIACDAFIRAFAERQTQHQELLAWLRHQRMSATSAKHSIRQDISMSDRMKRKYRQRRSDTHQIKIKQS